MNALKTVSIYCFVSFDARLAQGSIDDAYESSRAGNHAPPLLFGWVFDRFILTILERWPSG
jgi:hypothetical protein